MFALVRVPIPRPLKGRREATKRDQQGGAAEYEPRRPRPGKSMTGGAVSEAHPEEATNESGCAFLLSSGYSVSMPDPSMSDPLIIVVE